MKQNPSSWQIDLTLYLLCFAGAIFYLQIDLYALHKIHPEKRKIYDEKIPRKLFDQMAVNFGQHCYLQPSGLALFL